MTIAVIEIYDEINRKKRIEVSKALAKINCNIKILILRICSSGGYMVDGYEIFKMIEIFKLKNPEIKLIASIDSECKSAAYLIASVADEIFLSKWGEVGSIGVIIGKNESNCTSINHKNIAHCEYLDYSEYCQPAGKCIGKDIYERLHKCATEFEELVRKNRPKIKKDIPLEYIYMDKEALELGLVDCIWTFDELIYNRFSKESISILIG